MNHFVKVPESLSKYAGSVEVGIMHVALGNTQRHPAKKERLVVKRFKLTSTASKLMASAINQGHSKQQTFTQALQWVKDHPIITQPTTLEYKGEPYEKN